MLTIFSPLQITSVCLNKMQNKSYKFRLYSGKDHNKNKKFPWPPWNFGLSLSPMALQIIDMLFLLNIKSYCKMRSSRLFKHFVSVHSKDAFQHNIFALLLNCNGHFAISNMN